MYCTLTFLTPQGRKWSVAKTFKDEDHKQNFIKKLKRTEMKYAYVITLTVIFVLIQYSLIEYPIVLAVVNTILMVNSLWLIWSYYEKSK